MIKEYYQEMYGYETYETEKGFICYTKVHPVMLIAELYVKPKHRRSGVVNMFYKHVESKAVNQGCTQLGCSTTIMNKDGFLNKEADKSMRAILAFGFKPVSANSNEVRYIKEI